ncbi:uncharacterized protein K460DRAFT_391068 [Cucurbitaria berberidis CBS 394.84]|uniref:Altered inheritance of mitochondria protein 9, mitochondrial n=1 Tax=Cucurbitaria berberidis CBS 394.84 TaxID=1168544 RepID=A0A9P4GSR3_9PLEO|nr:uncharacterized protein K460DRAFT_391068 [Cucurbitaria berberidis CBS 394.84]KAF1850599.1 hypothetical protein K460DRAFT_391068 [Cucurbitaria berberidis CBS 394.84]
MHRFILSSAPPLVPHLRTQRTSPIRTSKLLPFLDTPAFIRFHPIFHQPFLGYATFSSSRQMIESLGESHNPYNYTSGRWLRRDALERESRLIRFDFDALCCKIIALCPGASSIVSYDKTEGGFNRVFIFHTNNAKRIVARLPFALAGPSRLTTNSEVATIKYLQAKTSIPIPKILDWSDDASNAIGSEYIIMEHALGIPLRQRWPAMDVTEQIRCIQAIYQKLKEIVDLDFPAYGSLYFANTPYISASKLSLNQEFCIGPHCGATYWNCNVGQPRYYHKVNSNQGPWSGLAVYCDGLIDTGMSRIPPAGAISKRPRYHGSIETHYQLLEHGRAVIREMAKDSRIQKAASPVMFHPDLHTRNIFVSEEDPTIVSAIIDWQSSSIEPVFWYADEAPDFAQAFPDPSDEDQFEPKSEACAKAFEYCTKFLAPKLSEARSMDEAFFRPFRYCQRTWEDGAVAFREELIQTSRRWKELGFAESCPFPLPTPDEYAVHQKDYKFYEAAHQLRHSLSGLLNTASDGWVHSGDWEATELAHRELFRGMLQEILGIEHPDDDEPIKSEEDLREIWPFELKE